MSKAPLQKRPADKPREVTPTAKNILGRGKNPRAVAQRHWTAVADVVAVLRRRWETGVYLRTHARGEAWEPVVLPVKGPTADELLYRFEDVRKWVAAFESDAMGRLEVEYRSVGGRNFGANRIPAKARLSSFGQLCSVLGTNADVGALDQLLMLARERGPELAAWAADHPLLVLEYRHAWEQVLATVDWIAIHNTERMYVRQIDVEGVDTKFVERHQKLFSYLLPLVLAGERVDVSTPGLEFARQFGFLARPLYTRFRILDSELSIFPPGISELTVRTDELAAHKIAAATVFIVENEVTYLAFPPVPRAIVVFGSGFAATGLAGLPWLRSVEAVYWGDIDTYGFDILSRLRAYLPQVRSVLMDRDTLLRHRSHWTMEEKPTRRPLAYLTEQEQSLYNDLVADIYGAGVRLEQERVRFSTLRAALLPWTDRNIRTI